MVELTDATTIAIIGAIVALATTVSPIILSVITASQRRKEKAQDYIRQDAVAAQAAEAARLLLVSNELVAKRTSEAAAETQGQLRQIHTLVNSKLTEEMKGRLEALDSLLAMTIKNIELNLAAGIEPTEVVRTALASLRRTVETLRSSLVERAMITEDAARSREL